MVGVMKRNANKFDSGAKGAVPLCVSVVYFQFCHFFHQRFRSSLQKIRNEQKLAIKRKKKTTKKH